MGLAGLSATAVVVVLVVVVVMVEGERGDVLLLLPSPESYSETRDPRSLVEAFVSSMTPKVRAIVYEATSFMYYQVNKYTLYMQTGASKGRRRRKKKEITTYQHDEKYKGSDGKPCKHSKRFGRAIHPRTALVVPEVVHIPIP